MRGDTRLRRPVRVAELLRGARDAGVVVPEYALLIGLFALVLLGATVGLGVQLRDGFEQTAQAFAGRPMPPVAQEPPGRMVLTYDTTAPGCADTTIALPVGGAVDGTVDWGDGSTAALEPAASHTFEDAGLHAVTINGHFSELDSYKHARDDAPCLISVDEWRYTHTITANRAFRGAANLTDVAAPPATVTAMAEMFSGATSFNGDVSSWDTSAVTTMQATFLGASSFNGDVSSWDTSAVTTMQDMFSGATSFNGDVSSWDVSNVETMRGMFYNARAFNQPLNDWDTSSLRSVRAMFYNARAFNQDLDRWDTSSVEEMAHVFFSAWDFDGDVSTWDTSSVATMNNAFHNARSFTGDIGDWDTSNVTTMRSLFSGAASFNSDISRWQTGSVTDMVDLLSGATSFNQDLSGWDVSAVIAYSGYDYATGGTWQADYHPHFN